MSFQNVEDWLRSLGLLHYAQSFYDNGYDNLEICKQISQEDLNVIGIKNEKDRTDIEIGVHQLGRDVLYFEVVPEDGQQASNDIAVVREKIDEVKLKSIIKEELELRNIQLTEPPYFYPDGTFGDLFGLAVSISLKLSTYPEDVFGALEQLQKRQLPAAVFDEDEEDAHPQEYLNVENPQEPTRTFSLSKYDKRITKSTTDLHSATTGRFLSTIDMFLRELVNQAHKVRHSNKDGSKNDLQNKFNKKRYTKGGNKQAFGQKILQSFRKKTPTNLKEGKELQRSVGTFNASDVRMTQDEIICLLGKVKKQELSQDEAIGTISRHLMGGSTTPTGKDSLSSANSSPEVSRKKTKKQKKSKGDELRRDKRSGSATFYTMGEEGTFKALLSEKLSDDSTISEDSRSIAESIPEEIEAKTSPKQSDSPGSHNKHHSGIIDKVRNSLRRGQKGTEEGSLHNGTTDGLSSSCSSSQDSVRSTDPTDASNGCTSIHIKVPPLNKSDKPVRTAPIPPSSKLKPSISFSEESSVHVTPTKKHSLGSNVANRIQMLPPLFPPQMKKDGSLPLNKVERPAPPPRKEQRSTSDPTTPTALNQNSSHIFFSPQTSPKDIAEKEKPVKHPMVPPRRRPSKDQAENTITIDISSENHVPEVIINSPPPVVAVADSVKARVRPTLPPRPPKGDKIPSGTRAPTLLEKAQQGEQKPAVESASPETTKKQLKAKPLKSLIATKLRRESIDISDEPYTLADGSWHIPHKMLVRYSEELSRTEQDVIDEMDSLRKELTSEKGIPFLAMKSGNCTVVKPNILLTLQSWLFEIGLPMFNQDLIDAGISTLSELKLLNEDDLKDIGVYDVRHVKRLFAELDKV